MLPLLVPNVVIGTENVVTHGLPNLSEEKKEEEKRGGKEGKFAFFSLDKLGCAWVTTFSVPITTLGTSDGTYLPGQDGMAKNNIKSTNNLVTSSGTREN